MPDGDRNGNRSALGARLQTELADDQASAVKRSAGSQQ